MADRRHGEERRFEERLLTQNDVCAIADRVIALLPSHVCRYDIAPDDMKDLLDFVRMFRDGARDTKKATKDFIIKKVIPKMVVAALLAFIADLLGVLRPLVNNILRAFRVGG